MPMFDLDGCNDANIKGNKTSSEELLKAKQSDNLTAIDMKWFTEFGHLNRGDMLTSEQHRCHNEKKKFQRRV